ncbi:hypothetical protein HG530_009058 [Fusarium avenaceum]|nr:hypothetical protein HG530_009058 [Fusarium avenaceum]
MDWVPETEPLEVPTDQIDDHLAQQMMGEREQAQCETQSVMRQDGLLDSVLIRASISDGLNSASHGVWAGVLHDPERSTRVDLILKVLDGVFKLLCTKLVFDYNKIDVVRVTYLDHAVAIGTLRRAIRATIAISVLERLELSREFLKLVHDLDDFSLSFLSLVLLIRQFAAKVAHVVSLIVSLCLGEVGLDAHACNGLVSILLIERQIHQGINKLTRLGADDLPNFLQLRDDFVGFLGGNTRHSA